jgi:hypothetical protein
VLTPLSFCFSKPGLCWADSSVSVSSTLNLISKFEVDYKQRTYGPLNNITAANYSL